MKSSVVKVHGLVLSLGVLKVKLRRRNVEVLVLRDISRRFEDAANGVDVKRFKS